MISHGYVIGSNDGQLWNEIQKKFVSLIEHCTVYSGLPKAKEQAGEILSKFEPKVYQVLLEEVKEKVYRGS